MKLFKYFNLFLQLTKIPVLCVYFCVSQFCLTFHFFAHCIRAMYMYILPTKVKSLAIECIISIIYYLIYVSYIFHHLGSNPDIEVRITDPHISPTGLLLNCNYFLCSNLHVIALINNYKRKKFHSGCVYMYIYIHLSLIHI